MNNKEKLQTLWAMTDKPLIDIMTRKTRTLPSTSNKKYSSEESNDSDSDSNNDFTALPEEFRPNLTINKPCLSEEKIDAKTSPNQTLRKQLIQSPTSAFRKPTKDTKSSNRSSPENQKSVFSACEQTSSFQNSTGISSKYDDSIVLKTGDNSKIRCQTVKNMILRQNNEKDDEISENATVLRRETSQQTLNAISNNQLLSQPNAVTSVNKHQSKKSLKYEYVQRQKQQTIQLNFDVLSFKDVDSAYKDGMKYETKLTRNTHTKHKNVTHMGNRIIKRHSRNVGKIPNLSESPVSFQNSIVKWDSSLNLKSDEDNKIEWAFIREEKTLFTARRVSGVRRNNELVSLNYNSFHTRAGNSLNKKFNNLRENETGYNQHTKPKTFRKSQAEYTESRPFARKFNSDNFAYKNILHSKNDDNIKYIHPIKNQDFNTEIESWDEEEDSCMEPRSISAKNAENILSLSSETLDLSHEKSTIDDRKWNEEVKLSPRNKEQYSFVQFQQASNDLGRPAEDLSSSRRGNSGERKLRDLALKKDSILRYGKEISDLIIGSYTALSVLISFYREWTSARQQLIFHFEQLGKNLRESSKNFSRFTDVINVAKLGTNLAQNIPHPTVVMAAKVVSVISSLLQTFLRTKKEEKANIEDSDEITEAVLKDTNTISDLYIYGLQCSQQFEETTKLIKEFHSNANIHAYFDCENPEIATFIRGFLELEPNHRVFYKKLHKCFQELLHTSTTSFSKRFCEPFTLCSSPTVDVIEYLGWRFRHEDFNGLSVRYELKEIQSMIENNSTTEDLQRRIQNCIRLLTEELEFMESCIKDVSLFDSTSDFSK